MAYLFILQGMLIDGQKWACEACVRGHRVTTCKHHDRPLIRIQRKGRPFSTCPVCNCTPCSSPEEHAKIRREADSKSSSKKAAGRLSRSSNNAGFLPIAPRPTTTDVSPKQPRPLPSQQLLSAQSGVPVTMGGPHRAAPVVSGPGPGPVDLVPSFSSISNATSIPSFVDPFQHPDGFPLMNPPSFMDSGLTYFEDMDEFPEGILPDDWSDYLWSSADMPDMK